MTDKQPAVQPIAPAPIPTNVQWEAVWGDEPVVDEHGQQVGVRPILLLQLAMTTAVGVGVYYFPAPMFREVMAKVGKVLDTAEAEGPPSSSGQLRPSGLIVPDVDVSQVLRSIEGGNGHHGPS